MFHRSRNSTWPVHDIHRNRDPDDEFNGNIRRSTMMSDPSDAAIDQIVESCNGDLRGALRALLLVNEHLEAELQQFYAAAAQDSPPRGRLLH
ncbi:hypothetical protein UP10_25245 [Bradyrhizobium sp. LTSPM299]|nr:hypothetical protein UP10_25245 [Bradyrhizobium sp. LTSPM299]